MFCVKKLITSQILKSRSFCSKTNIFDPYFGLTEDQVALRDTVYEFTVNEFRPFMREWDKNEHFPADVLRKSSQLGFGGLFVSSEAGGAGLNRVDSALALETLAMGCLSTSAYVALHNMVVWLIFRFGTDDQKSQFLSDLTTMTRFGAYCLTEPGSGSDAASLRTTAKVDGDHYVLNGSKMFITAAEPGNVFLVLCRTGGPGPKVGCSCFTAKTNIQI